MLLPDDGMAGGPPTERQAQYVRMLAPVLPDADDGHLLVVEAGSGAVVLVNRATTDALGFSESHPAPSEISQFVASLTGASIRDELTASVPPQGLPKAVPALLLGADYRLVPAILSITRRVIEGADLLIIKLEKVGARDVLRRGQVETSNLLGAAVDVAPDSTITIDEMGHILSFNAAAERAFGYRAEEVLGRNITMLMNDKDASEHDAHLARHFHTGERRIIGKMRVVEAKRKSGEAFPVELYVGEVRFGDRRLYAGFLRDITWRRAAEAELHDSAARLKATIDSALDAIVTSDERGIIESLNPAALQMFGYTADELIGANVSTLMPAPDSRAHDAYMRNYVSTGSPKAIGKNRVLEAQRKTGERFPIELTLSEMRFSGRRLFVATIRDITLQTQLQAKAASLQRELLHVTRLSSMGEMAAAIAHELNQPLTAIAAYAEATRHVFTASNSGAPSVAGDNLSKISVQAQRAGEIIRRMRQLAKGGDGQRHSEDINAIVREAWELAAVGAKSLGIDIRLTEAELGPISCDRIQIQQVIINLIRNAIDALTEHDSAGERRYVELVTARTGPDVRITVRDNGPGVSPSLRARLFEPFLTTKAHGMGIGLTVSQMIVESHQGRLWLDPDYKTGAAFHLTLPFEASEAAA
jgi:two-component system sensor kinase FixL